MMVTETGAALGLLVLLGVLLGMLGTGYMLGVRAVYREWAAASQEREGALGAMRQQAEERVAEVEALRQRETERVEQLHKLLERVDGLDGMYAAQLQAAHERAEAAEALLAALVRTELGAEQRDLTPWEPLEPEPDRGLYPGEPGYEQPPSRYPWEPLTIIGQPEDPAEGQE